MVSVVIAVGLLAGSALGFTGQEDAGTRDSQP
jgi:hypothetical protein